MREFNFSAKKAKYTFSDEEEEEDYGQPMPKQVRTGDKLGLEGGRISPPLTF